MWVPTRQFQMYSCQIVWILKRAETLKDFGVLVHFCCAAAMRNEF